MLENILRKLSRRIWNSVVHKVINNAYKRQVIDSHQMHAILGMWNRECWPEWSDQKQTTK